MINDEEFATVFSTFVGPVFILIGIHQLYLGNLWSLVLIGLTLYCMFKQWGFYAEEEKRIQNLKSKNKIMEDSS